MLMMTSTANGFPVLWDFMSLAGLLPLSPQCAVSGGDDAKEKKN